MLQIIRDEYSMRHRESRWHSWQRTGLRIEDPRFEARSCQLCGGIFPSCNSCGLTLKCLGGVWPSLFIVSSCGLTVVSLKEIFIFNLFYFMILSRDAPKRLFSLRPNRSESSCQPNQTKPNLITFIYCCSFDLLVCCLINCLFLIVSYL